MILFSDRCAVSGEAKQKIVKNIVHALSDFVEIESKDKVQLSVSTDSDLGTIYSVTVPVRRVKPEYQAEDEAGTITNIEYKDTGAQSGLVDVSCELSSEAFEMNGSSLEFKNPIQDAISRIRFAPQSNNLLISSWDSSLRLHEVDCSKLRFEATSEAALLDCCFQEESVAFSAGSDGSITRYDLQSGISNKIGNHGDIATCVEYSTETRQVITAGFDKKIIAWDIFGANPLVLMKNLDVEVESMSLSGFELIVAVGSSVDIYDLRNLDQSVRSNESCMDVPIRCVSSIPYCKGYAVGLVDGRINLEISYPSGSNNMGYMFRCFPKSRDGRSHVVPVNDIAFNPFISGVFVTGDNAGYVTAWDAKTRKRLFDLPSCSNSIASLAYNHEGQILAVASSHTYQEATEKETPPQIFVHKLDESYLRSVSDGSSSSK